MRTPAATSFATRREFRYSASVEAARAAWAADLKVGDRVLVREILSSTSYAKVVHLDDLGIVVRSTQQIDLVGGPHPHRNLTTQRFDRAGRLAADGGYLPIHHGATLWPADGSIVPETADMVVVVYHH